MGRIFQIGLENGNFAVSNIIDGGGAAPAKSFFNSEFKNAHDFAQASQDMGLGGGTPKIGNTMKFGQ